MDANVALFAVYLTVLLLLAWPLGRYLADVFFAERAVGTHCFLPWKS
jgi:K+-transporting ATPase A subunit